MGRNIGLQHLRGLKANMPALFLGEEYLCTDTFELFAGTASGNEPITLPVYSTTGVRQQKAHIVTGIATIGGGGSVTVTLSGAAVFINATSYVCFTECTSAKHMAQAVQNSGTSFTLNGAGGDIYNFVCIGA